MRRILLVIIALIAPIFAYAVGLGPIKVYTYLNQPLKADIPLLYLAGISLGDIKVQLAPASAYIAAGVTEPKDIPGLILTAAKNKQGKPYIQLVTKDPVTDPIITFMLEISWPGGELYREYTILLDPPTVITTPVTVPKTVYRPRVKVKLHRSLSQQTQISDVFAPPPTQMNEPATESKAMPVAPVQYYGPTKSGEQLREIAEKVRPAQYLTLDQIMVAIVIKNPHAFLYHNINGLEAGQRLAIPTSSEIQQVSVKDAEKVVIAQNQQWHEIQHGIIPSQEKIMSVLPTIKMPPKQASQMQKVMQLHPHLNLSLEKNAAVQLPTTVQATGQALAPTPTPTPSAVPTVIMPKTNTGLQSKLALSITTLNAIQEEKQVMQLQYQDLQKQNQSLQQQLSQRDKTLVDMQAKLAKIEASAALARLKQGPSAATKAIDKLEQETSAVYSSGATFLNHIPLIDWVVFLIFLILLASVLWLAMKLKQAQSLLTTKVEPAKTKEEMEAFVKEEETMVTPVKKESAVELKKAMDKVEAEAKAEAESEPTPESEIATTKEPKAEIESPIAPSTKFELEEKPESEQEKPENNTEPKIIKEQPRVITEAKEHDKRQPIEFEATGKDMEIVKSGTGKAEAEEETTADTGGMTADQANQEKLDLAQTYIAMQDLTAARELLKEVIETGNSEQQQKAQDMFAAIEEKGDEN